MVLSQVEDSERMVFNWAYKDVVAVRGGRRQGVSDRHPLQNLAGRKARDNGFGRSATDESVPPDKIERVGDDLF